MVLWVLKIHHLILSLSNSFLCNILYGVILVGRICISERSLCLESMKTLKSFDIILLNLSKICFFFTWKFLGQSLTSSTYSSCGKTMAHMLHLFITESSKRFSIWYLSLQCQLISFPCSLEAPVESLSTEEMSGLISCICSLHMKAKSQEHNRHDYKLKCFNVFFVLLQIKLNVNFQTIFYL